MDYWDYRKLASKLVPRQTVLGGKDIYVQKEKGRKSNYKQYNIESGSLNTMERLLSVEGIESFAEVSLRAQSCPMPLNVDLYDGLQCPFKCRYCFADYFRHSLYTSFFDNSKKLGLRRCPDAHWQKEMDKLMPHRGEKVEGENSVINAVRLGIPMRLGIRFEDFVPVEKKHGTSLRFLQYLSSIKYPTMINTKSSMPADDKYLEALAGNEGGAAVHITMISADDEFNKKMEPAAPSFVKRAGAGKILSAAGVRVVARIEPWMMFLNDDRVKTDEYLAVLKESGIHHLTLDSYSYSAYSKGIAENFNKIGADFERMFLLSSDSQWLSSFLLGKFIEYIRSKGFECSTFDQGNAPDNDDWICCSVGDYFTDKGAGFNWGSGVVAIRYIQSKNGESVRWSDFESFVLAKGGWLNSQLRKEVQLIWNGEGDVAWPIYWSRGLEAIGQDESGIIWRFNNEFDHRKLLWEKGGMF